MSLAAGPKDLYDLAATRPTLFPSTTFFVSSCLHFFLPISLGADISGCQVHSLIPALEVGSYVCAPPVGLSSLHPAPTSLLPLFFSDSHYRPATIRLLDRYLSWLSLKIYSHYDHTFRDIPTFPPNSLGYLLSLALHCMRIWVSKIHEKSRTNLRCSIFPETR